MSRFQGLKQTAAAKSAPAAITHRITCRVCDRPGLQAANVGIPAGYPDYVLHTMVRVVKGGEEVKISKRAGSYVTLRDLIEWTSTDAVRFFLLSRKPDTEYTFDVDLAVQKNNDNPVYYVQYAHARVCSVFRQAAERATLAPPAGARLLSPIYSITPHGVDFARPARLRIPFDASGIAAGARPVLLKAQPGSDWVIQSDTERDGDALLVAGAAALGESASWYRPAMTLPSFLRGAPARPNPRPEPLRAIAARLDGHLKRLEAEGATVHPQSEYARGREGLPFKNAGARVAGAAVGVRRRRRQAAVLRAQLVGTEDRRQQILDAAHVARFQPLLVLHLVHVQARRTAGRARQQVAGLIDDRDLIGGEPRYARRHQMHDRRDLTGVEHAAGLELHQHRGRRLLLVAHEHRVLRQREVHARVLHRGERGDRARQEALRDARPGLSPAWAGPDRGPEACAQRAAAASAISQAAASRSPGVGRASGPRSQLHGRRAS